MSPVSISWQALKDLRDGGNLVAGQLYRITDYVTTTAQLESQSAGHQFDIIVRADSTNKLSENASAIQHTGDTYFSESKLEAWELKYCLDNDDTRFMWADTSNGKGVIWWMKDEFDNECGYDFKNIQFKRYRIITMEKCPALKNTYSGYKSISEVNSAITMYPSDAIIDTKNFVWRYTFDINGEDHTKTAQGNKNQKNIIEGYYGNY